MTLYCRLAAPARHRLAVAVTATDVVVANAWTAAGDVRESVSEIVSEGVRLDNSVRSGETLFVLDDLYMYFLHQGRGIVEDVGVDNLVCGPRLPFRIFEAHYKNAELLPIEESDRNRIRSQNLLSLLEDGLVSAPADD